MSIYSCCRKSQENFNASIPELKKTLSEIESKTNVYSNLIFKVVIPSALVLVGAYYTMTIKQIACNAAFVLAGVALVIILRELCTNKKTEKLIEIEIQDETQSTAKDAIEEKSDFPAIEKPEIESTPKRVVEIEKQDDTQTATKDAIKEKSDIPTIEKPEIESTPKKVIPEWQKAYEKLGKDLSQRVNPLHEISVINDTLDRFMEIFDKAPKEEKQRLARAPLYPGDPFFGCRSIDVAKPLYYIFFRGDFTSLKKLEEYLSIDDYHNLGPYRSTFVHCLISGFEKLIVKPGSDDPVKCLEFLLQKAPQLAKKPNSMNTSPLKYAEHVCFKIYAKNQEFIDKHGSGGMGGIGKSVTLYGEVETLEDYECREPHLKKIIEILKKY